MSQELKVGIIGTGVMGQDHARNFAAGIRGGLLVAVADVNTQAAQELADTVGAEHVFRDGGEMIDSGLIDAVIIAAPDRFHAELTLRALEKRIPVLCEKPLAPTAEEAARVVKKEEEIGEELVTVGFMRRFDPGYLALRERLETQRDGALLMSHSIHRNVEAHPDGSSEDTITNSGIHEIDIIPWLAESPIVRVEWRGGRPSSLITKRQDPQLLLMEDANGTLHTVEVQVQAQYGYDVRCELVCETASVELPRVPSLVEQNPLLISKDLTAGNDYPADWRPRFAAAYRAELSAWVSAALERKRPAGAASARDALQSTIVANALVESMHKGETIDVPPIQEVLG
ncbi:MAG: Gfo/Idh/MocA family protein [Ancrocorticia sp.]|uniref:Gfo/Idh/MocA family protein n=1 Tax=Ancrocorticia sp. TaxID=2593684 RepID=UPI003F921496